MQLHQDANLFHQMCGLSDIQWTFLDIPRVFWNLTIASNRTSLFNIQASSFCFGCLINLVVPTLYSIIHIYSSSTLILEIQEVLIPFGPWAFCPIRLLTASHPHSGSGWWCSPRGHLRVSTVQDIFHMLTGREESCS